MWLTIQFFQVLLPLLLLLLCHSDMYINKYYEMKRQTNFVDIAFCVWTNERWRRKTLGKCKEKVLNHFGMETMTILIYSTKYRSAIEKWRKKKKLWNFNLILFSSFRDFLFWCKQEKRFKFGIKYGSWGSFFCVIFPNKHYKILHTVLNFRTEPINLR